MRQRILPSGRMRRRTAAKYAIVGVATVALMLLWLWFVRFTLLLPPSLRSQPHHASPSLVAGDSKSPHATGLQVESVGPCAAVVASLLYENDDFHHALVLGHSLHRRFSHPESLRCRVTFRLFVAPRCAMSSPTHWPQMETALRSAGWSEIVQVTDEALQGAESVDSAWDRVLRLLFLCGVELKHLVEGQHFITCGERILAFHPLTFLPRSSLAEPLNDLDFFRQAQLAHSDEDVGLWRLLMPSLLRIPSAGASERFALELSCFSESLPLSTSDSAPVAVAVEPWTIRWAAAATLQGLSWASVRERTEIRCLSRTSATNRVHARLSDAATAFHDLYGAATVAQRDVTAAYDVLKRIQFRVPLAFLPQRCKWDTVVRLSPTSGGLVRPDFSHSEFRKCSAELLWFLGLLEEALATIGRTWIRQDGTTAEARELLQVGLPYREAWMPGQASHDRARNLTTDALVVTLGSPGSSCLTVCATKKLGCAPAALDWWFPNSCRALAQIFPLRRFCTSESLPSLASVAPALRSTDGLAFFRDTRLSSRNATCAASEVDVIRVCTCIDPKEAASAEIRTLDEHRLSDQLELLAHVERNQLVGDAEDGEQIITEDEECPCQAGTRNVSTQHELTCLDYLANFSNVASVTPMSNDIKFGRTAKLKLTYRHACVEAIAKPPQNSFPLEPYAEYVAFELDRLLDLRLVPPTTWLFIPLSTMERATQSSEKRDGFARWFAEEVLLYVVRSRLTTSDPMGRLVVGCSVQLFVHGVRWQRGTALDYDDRYLDLLTPERGLDFQKTNWAFTFDVQHDILKTRLQRENVHRVLPTLSDVIVFDTLLANDDRSSAKNSHVFRRSRETEYEFVLLDQGKSFYRDFAKSRFTLPIPASPGWNQHASDSGAVVCMFRRKTYGRILAFSTGTGLLQRLRDLLPTPIWKAIGDQRMSWLELRFSHVSGYMHRCTQLIGDAALPWP